MRKYLLILFVILLSTSGFSALIDEMNVYINPEDQRTKVNYEIKYLVNQTTISIITFYNAYDVVVSSGGKTLDCNVLRKSVGTVIVCKDVNTDNVNISLYTDELVKSRNGVRYLNFEMPINNPINKTNVKIELPSGFVIVDEEKLADINIKPFYPENGKTETTGRTISIVWEISKPDLGKNLRFYVYYEQASRMNIALWSFLILLLFGVIIIAVLRRRAGPEVILAALSEDEKLIMEIILKKKTLYQKDIVNETGFSKAKVSRILKSFEERGLIKRERRGRKSKIKLVKFRW